MRDIIDELSIGYDEDSGRIDIFYDGSDPVVQGRINDMCGRFGGIGVRHIRDEDIVEIDVNKSIREHGPATVRHAIGELGDLFRFSKRGDYPLEPSEWTTISDELFDVIGVN